MMQVWLVLLGAVLMWQADKWSSQGHREPFFATLGMVLLALGYGLLVVSVVMVFVNGGTTG
jgi:hypothetical protein